MNAPVNVLAVMANASATFENNRFELRHKSTQLRTNYWSLRIAEMLAARSAVAKLIKAANECKATELSGMACIGSMAPCEHALGALFAALANIGETK